MSLAILFLFTTFVNYFNYRDNFFSFSAIFRLSFTVFGNFCQDLASLESKLFNVFPWAKLLPDMGILLKIALASFFILSSSFWAKTCKVRRSQVFRVSFYFWAFSRLEFLKTPSFLYLPFAKISRSWWFYVSFSLIFPS